MKKQLLLTTALVALIAAGNAWAAEAVSIDTETKHIEDNSAFKDLSYTGGEERAGAVTINANKNTLTIGNNVSFDNISSIKSGGAIKALNGFTTGSKLEIKNSHSDKAGGAIYIRLSDNSGNPDYHPSNRTINIGENAYFENNSSGWDLGGALAVDSAKEVNIGDGAQFVKNKNSAVAVWADPANKIDGVAVSQGNGSTINFGSVTFDGNTGTNGGAIASLADSVSSNNKKSVSTIENTVNLKGKAIFNGNEAKKGGAIFNVNGSTFNIAENAEFTGNKAKSYGGAIYNGGNMTIGNGAVFKNNTAEVGGGIAVETKGDLTISSATFENNHAVYDGGALGNYGIMNISGSTFKNNTAQLSGDNYTTVSQDSIPVGGGAISLGAVSGSKILSISDTSFIGNQSGRNGGAIATRLGKDANNSAAQVDIAATFTENHAYDHGGAIYNTFYSDNGAGKGKGLTVSGIFTNNSADKDGGAVYNDGAKDKAGNFGGVMTITDATFTGNTAGTNGGAVYNSENANLYLSGKNTFENNSDASGLNDIHNLGTLNVSGDLTLDGGISGEGTTVFANGANLTVKVNGTTIANTVQNEGANLNLVFANDFEGEYKLITGSLDNEFTGFDSNALFNIEAVANGTYNIAKKSTDEIASALGASSNKANAIAALTAGSAENNDAFNDVANSVGEMLQSGDKAQVTAAMDAAAAMSPEVAPMVYRTQVETTNQVFSAVSTRLSSGSVASGNEGIASGDNIFERGAVWLKGLFNHAKLEDDTTHDVKGFTSDSYGVAFGAEKFVTDDVKAGLGYAYTDTDISGFLRDTDVDTHTAFIYGEYKPADWFVNATASYSWSDYKEKKSVLGYEHKGDYDVDTFALQAMGGYDFHINGFNLTPEAGLRYVHVSQDSYTDTMGTRVASNDSDILTGIIGAKIGRNFVWNDMNFRPEVRVAATYDLKNDDASAWAMLANGASYQVNGNELKRFAVGFGAGVTAELTDSVEVTAAYEGHFRQDYYDNTGMLSAKYKF